MDFSEVVLLLEKEAQHLSITVSIFILLSAILLGIFIAWCYQMFSYTVFYSRTFHFSLIYIPFVVAMLIMSIKSDIAISLGILGALSIVRYRTPIKEPLDLLFILWAVAEGVTIGAGLFFLAFFAAFVLGFILKVSQGKFLYQFWKPKPYIIILRYKNSNDKTSFPKEVYKLIGEISFSVQEKHFVKDGEKIEIALEVVPKKRCEDKIFEVLKKISAEQILIISPEGNLISY